MRNTKFITLSITIILLISAYIISCSKPSTTTPTVTCADKTIVVSATTTTTSGGTTTNGSLTASASGSSGFSFSINGGAFQNSGTFLNLAAGSYSIIAKDDAGCTSSKSFTVTAASCPTILVTAVVTNSTTASTNNGSIVASATGSTGITFSRDGTTFQASGTFSTLATGSYTITAKDVNGCIGNAIFAVTTASCPTITVTGTSTQTAGPTATTGSINAAATGGVAPYTFSKDGITFQATSVFNNLGVNNYTIVAKDANGCLGSSANIAVTAAPCPTINISNATIGSDKCANNTGTITVTASGSTGLMYTINGTSFQTSNIFNNLGFGNYTVGVKDANGCNNTASASVAVAAAGPNFTNVKNILAANCTSCHGGAFPQNGINFTDDCTIVSQKLRIKARAVDANPSVMPPSGSISAADKQKITDWINAGGMHSN